LAKRLDKRLVVQRGDDYQAGLCFDSSIYYNEIAIENSDFLHAIASNSRQKDLRET